MARHTDRNKALALRLKGHSYSQIKEQLGVSKSTLHYWLKDHPLPEARVRELRDWSAQRIERFRRTMAAKKEIRRSQVLGEVSKRVSELSARELFLAGLFLYWAEGSKTTRYTVSLTNTDPAMLIFFIQWLDLIRIPRTTLQARLHLYTDMDIAKQTRYWSKVLGLPMSAFCRPYIKNSLSIKRRNYKGRFGQGTCCLSVRGRDIEDYVSMGIQSIRSKYMPVESADNKRYSTSGRVAQW
jgi:hypothetical protein